MSYIYLASPYTHEDQKVMQERYEQALHAAKHLTELGIVVYSPIVHFHEMARLHSMPRDAGFWQRQNYGMLQPATALVIATIPGWEKSTGVTWERQQATVMGKHISKFDPETKTWEVQRVSSTRR